jgi:protein-S-isoprenylcysteine O-methyltransferase Ste14
MTARDAPGVIAPPPLIYLLAFGAGLGLDGALPSASPPAAVAVPAGAALAAGGCALAGSFVAAFRRARTPVDPRHATTALVTSGPYRISRNPGYLGLTLVYTGATVATGKLWALVPLVGALVVIDRGVIAREERYLERKFGDEYRSYRARVRRWL